MPWKIVQAEKKGVIRGMKRKGDEFKRKGDEFKEKGEQINISSPIKVLFLLYIYNYTFVLRRRIVLRHHLHWESLHQENQIDR